MGTYFCRFLRLVKNGFLQGINVYEFQEVYFNWNYSNFVFYLSKIVLKWLTVVRFSYASRGELSRSSSSIGELDKSSG